MKLGIISDIHMDHSIYTIYPEDYDVDLWLNAGDTGPFLMRDYFHTLFPKGRYVWIHGNHDFYNEPIGSASQYCKEITIDGIKIAAATLWTDLTKGPLDWMMYKDGLIDHRYMKNYGWNEGSYNLHHDQQKDFLLTSNADVIMSHHAPSFQSTHERFKNDPYNFCFASELSEEILALPKPPKLWIHGHMHDACDYMIGETRVVSNPRGYPGETHNKHYKVLQIEV